MTFNEMRAAIEGRMATFTGCPIAGDNVPISDAVQAAQDANPQDPWCRITIQDGDRQAVTLGDAVIGNGVIFVQIFTAERSGSSTARTLADGIASVMQHWRDTDLKTRTAQLVRVGPSDGWYQVNVQVPFVAY